MNKRLTYRETFDRDSGGWYGWTNNIEGMKPLGWKKGRMVTRSPWWIDYNHAPPGAGYLHMLFCLTTKGPLSEQMKELGGPNRFVAGGYPRDFRGARMTLRLRGEMKMRGARVLLLVQAKVGEIVSSWLLTGRPFPVAEQWKEQSVVLPTDPRAWRPLGARHDRGDYYQVRPLDAVLGDVNANFLFVLFPLDVRPMGPVPGHPHRLRPGRDYPVWTSCLPEGYIELDTVQIDFKRTT